MKYLFPFLIIILHFKNTCANIIPQEGISSHGLRNISASGVNDASEHKKYNVAKSLMRQLNKTPIKNSEYTFIQVPYKKDQYDRYGKTYATITNKGKLHLLRADRENFIVNIGTDFISTDYGMPHPIKERILKDENFRVENKIPVSIAHPIKENTRALREEFAFSYRGYGYASDKKLPHKNVSGTLPTGTMDYDEPALFAASEKQTKDFFGISIPEHHNRTIKQPVFTSRSKKAQIKLKAAASAIMSCISSPDSKDLRKVNEPDCINDRFKVERALWF